MLAWWHNIDLLSIGDAPSIHILFLVHTHTVCPRSSCSNEFTFKYYVSFTLTVVFKGEDFQNFWKEEDFKEKWKIIVKFFIILDIS